MILINEMQKTVHKTALDHGWWELNNDGTANAESRNVPEQLMLMVTELAEAMEEFRDLDVHTNWYQSAEGAKRAASLEDLLSLARRGIKPEGFFFELADTVVRIMDTFEANHEQLEDYLIIKNDYNRTRPYRHGGRKA